MTQRNKTVTFTLTSTVANGSTFTVSYPDGFSDGDFENAGGHYILLNGDELKQPNDIGLSFGTTSVTVTNRTGATLQKGTGRMTFMMQGGRSGVIAEGKINGTPALKEVGGAKLVPLFVDLGAPIAADADGICASQSVDVSEADAVIDGALASTGATGASEVVIDAQYGRNVVASWTGTSVLIVQGEDYLGQELEERSASGTSHTGTKAFKKITRVTFTADVTAATVGTADVLGLPVRIPGSNFVKNELQDNVALPRKPGYMRVPFAILESELDGATTAYIYPGVAGTVVDAGAVVGDSVTTGGAVTFTVSGTAINGLTLTLGADAAGTVYSDTPTLGHASTAVLSTDYISVVPDSAINASGRFVGWVGVQPSNLLNGTLVAGLAKNTKSTATTGDVRGTYDPGVVLDGTTSVALEILVPEPYDIGNPQYTA